MGFRHAHTAVGEEMARIVAHIEDEVLAVDRRVRGRDRNPTGLVRLTTVDELAQLFAPDLKRFRARYPGITLDVNTEQRVLSLARGEADVALRPGGRPTEADVIGRRLVELRAGIYAAPAYLAEHAAPRATLDLADHDWVAFDEAHRHVVTMRWLDEHVPPARVVLRCDAIVGQVAAVRAGVGLGIAPCFLAEPEGLVRLLVDEADWRYGIWLLLHADLRQTARVRAFVDFLTEAVAARAEQFAGHTPPDPHRRTPATG